MPHGPHVPTAQRTQNLQRTDQMPQTLKCLMRGDEDEDKTWWTIDDYIRWQWLEYCKQRTDSRIEWLVWLAGSFHGEGKRRNGQWELEVNIGGPTRPPRCGAGPEDQNAARHHSRGTFD